MAKIIPELKKSRIVRLAQTENRYSFHWTFDEGQFELNFQDEVESIKLMAVLKQALRLSQRSRSMAAVIGAMPPMTFEFDLTNSASDLETTDELIAEALELFDDVSPLCIPLTVENSVVWISGEPEARMEISAEVVFSLKVKPNVDVLDVQDFIDRNSVWSAGYISGNWLGGYTSDSGGFLRCLNASQ